MNSTRPTSIMPPQSHFGARHRHHLEQCIWHDRSQRSMSTAGYVVDNVRRRLCRRRVPHIRLTVHTSEQTAPRLLRAPLPQRELTRARRARIFHLRIVLHRVIGTIIMRQDVHTFSLQFVQPMNSRHTNASSCSALRQARATSRQFNNDRMSGTRKSLMISSANRCSSGGSMPPPSSAPSRRRSSRSNSSCSKHRRRR